MTNAEKYTGILENFRHHSTRFLTQGTFGLAELPVTRERTLAIDIALFILKERMDIVEFQNVLDKIEKISPKPIAG
jgi:hypothetical protein